MSPFYKFQSYPNTYCTKLKCTIPKAILVTPKMDTLVCHNLVSNCTHQEDLAQKCK